MIPIPKVLFFKYVICQRRRTRPECLWRHSKEEADLLAYVQQCRSVSMQLKEAKINYYPTKIEASNNDQKSFFNITKTFMVNQQIATALYQPIQSTLS